MKTTKYIYAIAIAFITILIHSCNQTENAETITVSSEKKSSDIVDSVKTKNTKTIDLPLKTNEANNTE